MIEFRVEPRVKSMTRFASRRKVRTCVVRIRRLLIIPLVAGNALRREPLKLSDCRTLVTFFALHRCVRAKKRKAVLMILHLLHRDIPSANGMALRAIRTELPPVNIRVTIRAILSHVCKNRFHVALRAVYFFVHAAQRIVRVVVIEFRVRPDRTPCRRCMAVLARDRQRPVRAAGSLSLGEGGKGQTDQAQTYQNQKLDGTWRKIPRDPRSTSSRAEWAQLTLILRLAIAGHYCTEGQIVFLYSTQPHTAFCEEVSSRTEAR